MRKMTVDIIFPYFPDLIMSIKVMVVEVRIGYLVMFSGKV